jgi:hypothetical protein
LKIREDKIFSFINNLREHILCPVCEIISSQNVLLLKRTQFQTLRSTFFVVVSSLVSGIKEMGHGELTTTISCSSFMPLCLQRNQPDITLKVFRTGLGISFFPGRQT